jgi:hypothetical protein
MRFVSRESGTCLRSSRNRRAKHPRGHDSRALQLRSGLSRPGGERSSHISARWTSKRAKSRCKLLALTVGEQQYRLTFLLDISGNRSDSNADVDSHHLDCYYQCCLFAMSGRVKMARCECCPPKFRQNPTWRFGISRFPPNPSGTRFRQIDIFWKSTQIPHIKLRFPVRK